MKNPNKNTEKVDAFISGLTLHPRKDVPVDENKEKVDAFIDSVEKARVEIARRGFRRGSGGKSIMPCVVPGCRGVVSFAVCNANGHTMGVCSVKGCLNWIE